MAVTQNTYTGNGSTVLFSFTFPYLETTDVKVSLNGTVTTSYTFANATTIQFNTAPANGVAIRIYRETDDAALAATFYPGSAIRSSDLNENFTQNLYVTQESTNNAVTAITTANTALTNSNTAISTANSAISTANTASANASTAVSTANTASTNASTAVSTANTASTNATAAVNTANTAATDASNAVTTANTASSNASTALSTANTAASDASTALSTANTASTNATTAVNTANNALSTANSATTTANTASTNATAALNAVANSLQYVLVANVAAIPSSPSNNYAIELADSTGIESFTPLANRPAGFVGDVGLSVRMQYSTTGPTWNWLNYFPNNAETRYLKFAGGTITGNLEIGNTGSLTFEGSTANAFETTLAITDPTVDRTITLPDVSGTVVTTGDTGTVTSTMIADGTIADADINASAAISLSKLATGALPTAITVSSSNIVDGTIVNADVSASAAIAGTKISPDFGSQNVTTTGTSTAASFIPSSSTVPTNGVYLPAANSVAISTDSVGRLFVDASGNVGVNQLPVAGVFGTTGLNFINSQYGTISAFIGRRAQGTSSSPAAISSGTTLSAFVGRGYDGSAFQDAARMTIQSDGAITSTSSPGFIAFETVPSGSVGFVERLRIASNGSVGIGTQNPSQLLHVNGNAVVGGSPAARYSNFTVAGTSGIQSATPLLNLVNAAGSTRFGYIYHNGTGGNIDILNQESGGLTFGTNNTERARIDSSGRLLIGTSSVISTFGVSPQFEVAGGEAYQANLAYRADAFAPYISIGHSRSASIGTHTILQNGDDFGTFGFVGSDGSSFVRGATISAQVDGTPGTNSMPGRIVLSTAPSGSASPVERMRITNNGDIFFNTTVSGGEGGISIVDGAAGARQFFWKRASTTSTSYPLSFNNGSANVGFVSFTNTATSYVTSSDYRLKENVTAVTDGITRLQQLKPCRFNFIADPAKTVDGFLAHEAAEVVPECVTGEKDAVDDDGNPIYQGIDQSKLVPLLTAALQEAVAKIESLAARLTAAGI